MIEQKELTLHLEKTCKQLNEVELLNCKLKAENEEAKVDMRKLMRT